MPDFEYNLKGFKNYRYSTESRRGIIRRFLSRLKRMNWRKKLRLLASKLQWTYEESEIEIMVQFLKSIDSELLERLWLSGSLSSLLRYPPSKICICAAHSEALFQVACHEAGHVVSLWFTDSPKKLSSVTIVPNRNFLGRDFYEDICDDVYENADNLFSEMCGYMGGEINSQLLSPKQKVRLNGLVYDMAMLTKKTYDLAKLTLDEVEEKDLTILMLEYFWKCYDVTVHILVENKSTAKALAYALFVEKELHYSDVLEILGPRPQFEKSLYEEFVKNQLHSVTLRSIQIQGVKLRWSCDDRHSIRKDIISKSSVVEFKFLDDSSSVD